MKTALTLILCLLASPLMADDARELQTAKEKITSLEKALQQKETSLEKTQQENAELAAELEIVVAQLAQTKETIQEQKRKIAATEDSLNEVIETLRKALGPLALEDLPAFMKEMRNKIKALENENYELQAIIEALKAKNKDD